MARIEAICISRHKGMAKTPVEEAEFATDWGIADDAHAGKWHRQVSILAAESIEKMKDRLPDLTQGAFAENIITTGLDLSEVEIGDLLEIGGKVILEVTQLGKDCHETCEIRRTTGDCIMPREGVFARVRQGGLVRSGDQINRRGNCL